MITLVTGGARSGKSTFAESIYNGKKDVVYIATSKVTDKEMEERVRLHRASRDSDWRTFEGNYELYKVVENEKHYLLDCVTVLSSNILFDFTKKEEYIDYKLQRKVEDKIMGEIKELIQEVEKNDYELVMVTNELGYSTVPEHHISRVFRDIQGRINQRVASLSDNVYLVCCGIPVKIK